MNLAYIHLLTNHLPILGSIFGVLLLFIAYFKPQLHTAFSAYLLLLISGIGGMLAYFTGEAAEEHVEHLPGISENLIHLHEEMAENTLIFIFLLTAASIIGLWSNHAKWEKAKQIQLFIMIVGIIAFILFAFTGYLGGHIRHAG
jgi:uncharacterized membrane protein